MLVVMTVRTVVKVPFEKAAPPLCPSDILAPLIELKTYKSMKNNIIKKTFSNYNYQ